MMRRLTFSISIFITLMTLSCGSSDSGMGKNETQLIQWQVLGHLPEDSAGRPSLGLAGPVAGISDDLLILGGGSNFPAGAPWTGGIKKYYRQLYIYSLQKDPDTLILKSAQFQLPFDVAYAANYSTSAGLIMAGGENNGGLLKNALLIQIDPQNRGISFKNLPALPEATTGAMLTAVGNLLYFAGGNTKNGTSAQLLLLDLDHVEKGWEKLPDLPEPVSYGVLYAVPSLNRLYIAGGRKSNDNARSTFYAGLYQFDLERKQWTRKTDLPYALSAQTGIAYNDNYLLVFGGDQGTIFHQTEDLLIKIAGEKDSSAKQRLILEKNQLQESHPGFSKAVLAYDIQNDLWQKVDTLQFSSQVTTTAIPWGGRVIIPCGEIRAGVRFSQIIEGAFRPHSD